MFIAESPPASGGFFYFPETIRKDHLFSEAIKARPVAQLEGFDSHVLVASNGTVNIKNVKRCRTQTRDSA